MSIAQYVLLCLVLFGIALVILRYRQNKIGMVNFMLWFLLWVAGGLTILFPEGTIVVAHLLGIGRGVDLVLYLCVVLSFYLIFRLYVRFEQMEKNITDIVRVFALQEAGLSGSTNERNRSEV